MHLYSWHIQELYMVIIMIATTADIHLLKIPYLDTSQPQSSQQTHVHACVTCRLGSVARKQGNPAMCKDIIANMYGYNAMEVQEAFNKIREQARAFLAQPGQLTEGLNLVNQQDLGYFQPLHQAELFRLKGVFLQASRAAIAFVCQRVTCQQDALWALCSSAVPQLRCSA